MILADTSVWIDFLRQTDTRQTGLLESAILEGQVFMGDLILVEILQGVASKTQERQVVRAFGQLPVRTLCGPDLAPIAAANYRLLRRSGLTVRGTIDVIIATWCIENRVPLLHNDHDFSMMENELGLVTWR